MARILLVEDHADSAFTTQLLLERWGHSVEHAATIGAAMGMYDPERFDLLICDIGLPDGSGHDLMTTLCSRAPVCGIAVSGFGREEDVRRSIAAGFFTHITKPFNAAELRRAIEEAATRK